MSAAAAEAIDAKVAERILWRRCLLGMSQMELGQALGITAQQVQKYESGENRVSASRLFMFAQILKVQTTFFFTRSDGKPAAWPVRVAQRQVPGSANLRSAPALLERSEAVKLVAAFYRIPDAAVRREIIVFIRALGS